MCGWPRGLMDKASDFGSEDWGFESLRGRIFLKIWESVTWFEVLVTFITFWFVTVFVGETHLLGIYRRKRSLLWSERFAFPWNYREYWSENSSLLKGQFSCMAMIRFTLKKSTCWLEKSQSGQANCTVQLKQAHKPIFPVLNFVLLGVSTVIVESFSFAFTANTKRQTAGCCLS